MVKVLKRDEDKFEPNLPFRITEEEIARLHEGDGEMVEKAILRMCRIGLLVNNDLLTEDALDLAEELINKEDTWKKLLDSQPPINVHSDL